MFARNQNAATNGFQSEGSDSKNLLLDTEEKGLAKGGAEESKGKKAGASLDNPIDVDDYIQTIGRESQNIRIEERIQKLEKLLGQSHNEYKDAGKKTKRDNLVLI